MGLLPNPRKSPRLYNFLRWVGLCVGCFAKFVTGSLFVFNAYEGALKSTFNYTETEVELQSSLLNVGLGVGFVPGMFYDKFGPTWTSFAGLLVSVGSYLLLWSTTKSVSFYRDKSWLTAIYFFLSGFGSVFTYMVALNTNVINFHEGHRGKIVGLLNAFFAGSPSVFAAIYYHVISGSDVTDRESFGNFMMLFAILFGVADLMCVIFLRIYDSGIQEKLEPINGAITSVDSGHELTCCGNSPADVGNSPDTESLSQGERIETRTMSLMSLAINGDYHLLTWMFAFISSVGLVYVNNLTEIGTSFKLKSFNSDLVLIIPITNAIVSVGTGALSDKFKEKVPRLFVMLSATVVFSLALILTMTAAYNNYPVLAFSATLCGIGVGLIWTIGPSLMSEYFSVKNLGRNWGIAILLASLVGFGQQIAFGHIYDANKVKQSDLVCTGINCIRGGLGMSLGSAILALVLGAILTVKRRRKDTPYSLF